MSATYVQYTAAVLYEQYCVVCTEYTASILEYIHAHVLPSYSDRQQKKRVIFLVASNDFAQSFILFINLF